VLPGSLGHSEFAGTEVRRAQAAQRRLERRHEDALETATAFAHRLCTEFGATEVILFGSVLYPDRFTFRSDIDLAVRGLGPSAFLAAYGQAMDGEIPVDLVDLDGDAVRPEVLGSIVREGRHLEP